jgi:putative ABC transport system permease protein
LAWRDLATARAKSALIALSAAVSVAGIAGVYGAASVAEKAMRGDSRAWLAGDIGVDLREPVNKEQADGLNRAKAQGVRWTIIATALTMAASDQSADAAFIGVKAVDPAVYPFYGAVALSPDKPLKDTLTAEDAVVSSEVLDRLSIGLGDTFLIAGQPFRAAAVITAEPDRFSGAIGLGMRCILSREGYARTGLEDSGTAVSQRLLLQLSGDFELPKARRFLENLFPGGSVREYRSAYGRQVDEALTFLSVTAFLALMLGAIGVWICVRQHASDSMAKLATIKILGGGSAQTSAVFFLQVAALFFVGILAAAPLGLGVQASVLSVMRKYLALPPRLDWNAGAIGKSTLAGAAAIGSALVEPLILIRRLRPAVMLRQAEISTTRRPANYIRTLSLSVGVAGAAGAWLASSTLGSWSAALLLVSGLALSIALCWILAGALLAVLTQSVRRGLQSKPSWLRLGIAGLYRPAHRPRLLIAALATAFLTMIATSQARDEVIRAVFELLPYRGDSLYIGRFRNSQKDSLLAFLKSQPGVTALRLITQTKLRLRFVSPPIVDTGPLYVSYTAACEPAEFFPASRSRSQVHTPAVMADDVAAKLGVRPGSQLELEGRDQTFWADVREVRKLTPAERVWSTLHLDCSGLEEGGLFHQMAVAVPSDSISAVRRALIAEYPALAVITVGDIEDTAEAVSRDAGMLVRIVAWLAVGAGLVDLLAIISASRTSRLREIGILSALGARRALLIRIYTLEFAVIGMLAGVIAAIISEGFSTLVLSLTFREFHPAREWKTAAVAVAISTLLTIAAGWLPTWGLLRRKPMEILRGLGAA